MPTGPGPRMGSRGRAVTSRDSGGSESGSTPGTQGRLPAPHRGNDYNHTISREPRRVPLLGRRPSSGKSPETPRSDILLPRVVSESAACPPHGGRIIIARQEGS